MKYLTFIFLLFSFQSYSQITGNIHVKDSSAIRLDSIAKNSLIGKWKLVETEEFIRNEEQRRDRGIIVNFDKEGNITTSWCFGCHEEKVGQWEVLNEQTIKISDSRKEENIYLGGEWVVYKLTDEEMILAKVLTSTGDWKKLQYFSRKVGSLAVTGPSRYCINCTEDENGRWCWGDQPERAKQHLVIVTDQIDVDGDQYQKTGKILEGIDWLLTNAPCINNHLYVKAINYYESLLTVEKEKEVIELYKEKLKHIKEQQQRYFKQ